MAFLTYELNKIDYDILKYINKFKFVSEDKIATRFSHVEGIFTRLEGLSSNDTYDNCIEMSGYYYIRKRPFSKPILVKTYRITQCGKIVLQNYIVNKKVEEKSKLIWKMLLPVALAVIISRILSALE